MRSADDIKSFAFIFTEKDLAIAEAGLLRIFSLSLPTPYTAAFNPTLSGAGVFVMITVGIAGPSKTIFSGVSAAKMT